MLFINPNKQIVLSLIVVRTRRNFLMFLMYARRVCKSRLAPRVVACKLRAPWSRVTGRGEGKKKRKKKEGRKRGNEGNDLSRATKQATLYCIRSFSTRQMAFPFLFISFFLTPPLLPPSPDPCHDSKETNETTMFRR